MTISQISRTVLDSKAVLARLMATENISVEHVPSAQTAYFDTQSRRLVFPCWQNMDSNLYDMLAGHETAHALFTPAGAQVLVDAIRKVDTRNGSNAAKTFLNIVEDARIERLMKARLPGLRRSFFTAYQGLMEHPLFKDMLTRVTEMRLIDRVNIHYKWGAWVKVPFTTEELPLVQRVAETKTFEDVIEVSRLLWEMQREQENSEPQPQEEQQSATGAEGDEQGEGESQPMQSSSTRDPKREQQVESEKKSASQQDNKDGKSQANTGSDSNSKAPRDSASSKGSKTGNGKGETVQQEIKEPTAAETDNFMRSISDEYRNETAPYYMPATMPRFDTSIGVIPFRTKVLPILSKFNQNFGGAAALSQWESTSRRDVSLMQQEFLRRMSADAASRTSVSDTGVIDVNRLWSYKISDEIFLQNTTVRNGQSHGIVIFVDFSGSMSGIMPETIRQMLMLAAWCRRANIPCDVYGFSDGVGSGWTGIDPKTRQTRSPWQHNASETNRAMFGDDMRLVHLISTKGLSERDWRMTAGGLLTVFSRDGRDARSVYYTNGKTPEGWTVDEYRHACRLFQLNSTPTMAATAAALDLIPEFKARNGVQIVHFVTLTDGDASDTFHVAGKPTGNLTPWGDEELSRPVASGSLLYNSGYDLRDPVTGRQFRTNNNRGLKPLVQMLQTRVEGLSAVGISIGSRRDFKGMMRNSGLTTEQQNNCWEQSKRDGFLQAPGAKGYSVWFGVPTPHVDESDYFDDVDWDSGKAALTKAFTKTLEQNGNNRLLCARLVDLMAKPASKSKETR
jgi:hypothetical protein